MLCVLSGVTLVNNEECHLNMQEKENESQFVDTEEIGRFVLKECHFLGIWITSINVSRVRDVEIFRLRCRCIQVHNGKS